MADENLPPLDPPDPRAPEPKARTATWVRILLFGSLALNLLIVGLIVGALGKRAGFDRDGAPRLRDAGLGPLSAVVTKDQREALRGNLRVHAADLRANREAMRGDMRRLVEALRAERFDAESFAGLLGGQRATMLDRVEIGHRALVEAVASASPGERRAMADRLEKALRRHER